MVTQCISWSIIYSCVVAIILLLCTLAPTWVWVSIDPWSPIHVSCFMCARVGLYSHILCNGLFVAHIFVFILEYPILRNMCQVWLGRRSQHCLYLLERFFQGFIWTFERKLTYVSWIFWILFEREYDVLQTKTNASYMTKNVNSPLTWPKKNVSYWTKMQI